MYKLNLIILVLFKATSSFAQKPNHTLLSETDPHELYLRDGKTNALFYYDLTPAWNDGTVLFLMPGLYRTAKDVFMRTNLPNVAYTNKISTLISSINSRIHPDTTCFNLINKMLLDFSERNNIEIRNVIIAGLSAGGFMSLSYTIWMNKN